MADDREKWSDEDRFPDESTYDEDSLDSDALASEEAFDAALDALEAAGPDALDAAGEFGEPETEKAIEREEPAPLEKPIGGDAGQEMAPVGETERLRQPRAPGFRRRLRMQIGVLPLALFVIALGAYLIARERDVRDLPDFSTLELGVMAILAVGFTFVFHALVFGRRERGLLFLGFWIWLTAGVVALVALGIEADPEAGEWWPLLLVSMGLAFVVTYLVERLHDARLLLLGITTLIISAIAFLIARGMIEQDILDRIADYWPLLFSVIGVGLLPLVFRRQAG